MSISIKLFRDCEIFGVIFAEYLAPRRDALRQLPGVNQLSQTGAPQGQSDFLGFLKLL